MSGRLPLPHGRPVVIIVLVALALSPPIHQAIYGAPSEDAGPSRFSEADTSALYVQEAVGASLEIIGQYIADGDIQDGSDVVQLSKLNTKILAMHLQNLREHNAAVSDELHVGLLDLHDQLGAAPEAQSAGAVAHLQDLVAQYSPTNPDHGKVMILLLTLADEQYQHSAAVENRGSYMLAHALAVRSQDLFAYTEYDQRLTMEIDSFLDELVDKMANAEDFHSVGTLINAINRDLAGHESAVHDRQALYQNIRVLYAQLLEALDAGDYAVAEEIGIEAYLENFEYLEPDIDRVDPELLHALEWDMREELRQMISNGQDAERIRTFVEESILPDLATAEHKVNSALGDGGSTAGTAAALPNKDLKGMGDATDDQKSTVRGEIDFIRATLQEMMVQYADGDYQSAYTSARTAYLDSYEYVEIPLRAIDPDFTLEVEFQFAELRNLIKSQAEYEKVEEVAISIKRSLDESERIVTGTGTLAPTIAFSSSLAVIFREGLESVLILGAIVTYLEASRNQQFKRYVYYGVVAALGATAVTWFIASYIIEMSGANRELIEAIAALSATAILFYVSFWVLNKIEHKKWMEFVKAKVWQATTTGSVMVFVMLAFFTVYREGFETVLFYHAMFGMAKYMEMYVGLGFLVGIGLLLVLWYVMRRLGRRLPLRVLFGLTMGVGAYLSIAFLGNGIRELQVLEIVPMTSLLGSVPRLDINMATMTGIYPTLETIVGQAILFGVYMLASMYVLVMRPRKAARLAGMRRSRGGAGDGGGSDDI